MRRLFALLMLMFSLAASPAPIIGAFPYTISNGQHLDAVPLMADLNWIQTQVNANTPSVVVASSVYSNAFSYLSAAQITDVQTRAQTLDLTSAIQGGINALAATGGGTLYFPTGTYKGNWIVPSYVTILGSGQEGTVFVPAINDHVFKTPVATSYTGMTFQNFSVHGDLTFAASDCIHIETTNASAGIGSPMLWNVRLSGCGQYGLNVKATYASGTNVSNLIVGDSLIINNKLGNVVLQGFILESLFLGGSISDVVNTAADSCSLCIKEDGIFPNYAVPKRANFKSIVFTNVGAGGHVRSDVDIRAGRGIQFDNCDFEGADPAILVENVAQLADGMFVANSNFGFSAATTNAIILNASKNTFIENSIFESSVSLTNAINYNGATIDVLNHVKLMNNRVGATNYVVDTAGFYYTLITGVARVYRDFFEIRGEGGAADDLTTIYDDAGATSEFEPGRRITITPFSTTTITVKHGTGNIYLSGGADFVMASANHNSLTLVWDNHLQLWHEAGRS